MRICIAPMDIASYYSGLKLGLEQSGIPVRFYVFDRNPFSRFRPGSGATLLERLIYWFSGIRWGRSLLERLARRGVEIPLRLGAFLAAVIACDVFIFAFGKTFFNRLELPLLRLLGKRVVFVFNGSDSRPAWMSGICIHGSSAVSTDEAVRQVRRQGRQIRWMERFAWACIDHPLSAQLHRRPFINHLRIGHPCPPAAVVEASARAHGGAVRIVHAPTRPEHKGSREIGAAIEALRAEGHAIDFIELIGRPNSEVLEHLSRCDLVIDELYSDIPLAGLGTEAARAGKPALVGGYGAEELRAFIGSSGLPTELYVHPSGLLQAARDLVQSRERRERLGSVAERFVRTEWDPRRVAERFIAIIRRRQPRSWWVDPKALRYWQGWGAPQEATLAFMRRIAKTHGLSAFGIDHNAALRAQIARLVKDQDQDSSP